MTALSFHPHEPLLFVATQRHIRIYDLVKCELKKKILTGSQWLSCIRVDAGGENVFAGGHDKIFAWIDLELSNKPWKSVRHHKSAIRAITQHPRFYFYLLGNMFIKFGTVVALVERQRPKLRLE